MISRLENENCQKLTKNHS